MANTTSPRSKKTPAPAKTGRPSKVQGASKLIEDHNKEQMAKYGAKRGRKPAASRVENALAQKQPAQKRRTSSSSTAPTKARMKTTTGTAARRKTKA